MEKRYIQLRALPEPELGLRAKVGGKDFCKMVGMADDSTSIERADHDTAAAETRADRNPFAWHIGVLQASTTQGEIHAWIHALRGHDRTDDAEWTDRGNRT